MRTALTGALFEIERSQDIHTMSGLTTEYIIKESDNNSLTYEILIHDFQKKIKSFKNGRDIHSKIFSIGESKFRIRIYPNGDSKQSKGSVSVYLHNLSDWKVKVKATFRRTHTPDDYIFYSDDGTHEAEAYIDAGQGHGWQNYTDHQNLDLDDGTFEVRATITVLEEQVTAQRDLTGLKDGVKEELGEVKEEVHEIKVDVTDVKEELRSIKRHQERELAAIHRGIEELRLSMQSNASAVIESRTRGIFECPMCTKEAKPPMRLKQCGEGHIICDTCYARDEQARQREGRERNQCGVCRGPITGRPTAFETFLGLS